jgi:hypothetical protein
MSSADSPLERHLSELIAEYVRDTTSFRPSPAELRSWDRSLPVLANDLLDAGQGKR